MYSCHSIDEQLPETWHLTLPKATKKNQQLDFPWKKVTLLSENHSKLNI
jgi:hypothetical protein